MAQRIDELVETARPRLLHLAQLNGVGLDSVEDVVQETFLEAWRSLPRLREPARLSAWLDGICRNVCKRYLHAKASTPQSPLPENLDGESLGSSVSLVINPVEDLEHQDRQVLLDRALSHLEESTRVLIELCYLAELPQREVAERLGLSLGALEQNLYRARRQLHQIFHGALREDAQAFGLNLREDEAMGWRETRLWCFVCGKRYLRGVLEHNPGGGTAMRLRCPGCSPRYDTDFTNTATVPGLGPLRSFRPALKRVMQAGAHYYQACLTQQHCPTCQSRVQIQIVDRSTLLAPRSLYDTLPLGIYAHVNCPSCGTGLCEAYIPALRNLVIRDFLLRPRITYEPATFTTYEGSAAVRFRLVDRSSSESLTVLAHPRTLHVLVATEH